MAAKDPDLQVLTLNEVRGTRRRPTAPSMQPQAPPSRSQTCPRRGRLGCFRLWTSMTFSAIGVITVLIVYLVGCAIIFKSIESHSNRQVHLKHRHHHDREEGYLKSGHIIRDEYSNDVLSLEVQEQQHLREARELRQQLVEHLWKITEELNILYKDNWTALANREVIKFQKGLLNNGMWRPSSLGGARGDEADYQSVPMDHRRNEIQVVLANAEREAEGAPLDGPAQPREPGVALARFTWNFFSSFLYSLSLVTTVGYPQQVPETSMGKILTMICALLGIPLLLIYLVIVGNCLAGLFSRFYGKLCCQCCLRSSSKRLPSSSSCGRDEFDLSDFDSVGGSSVTSRSSAHHASFRDGVEGRRRGQMRRDSSGLPVSSSTSLNGKDMTSFPDSASSSRGPQTKNGDRRHHHHSNHDEDHHHHHQVPGWMCFILIIAYVCGSASLFSVFQGWEWLESVFFCFTLLATIGFVDVPATRSGQMATQKGSKPEIDGLFVTMCTLYLLVGLALVSMGITILIHSWTHTTFATIVSSCATGGQGSQGARLLDHEATLDYSEGPS
ncbi:uncharacterized protein LOC131886184 [Tigriopus californicus]|uniref:uncharacterized protein LOC131886184 n=1 Tax=Tigriopus californicus TaxID=6832 RepID=UPI0027DA8818|nr:uncharacterized protein LOC131886184 [Tigriopus californicus]